MPKLQQKIILTLDYPSRTVVQNLKKKQHFKTLKAVQGESRPFIEKAPVNVN